MFKGLVYSYLSVLKLFKMAHSLPNTSLEGFMKSTINLEAEWSFIYFEEQETGNLFPFFDGLYHCKPVQGDMAACWHRTAELYCTAFPCDWWLTKWGANGLTWLTCLVTLEKQHWHIRRKWEWNENFAILAKELDLETNKHKAPWFLKYI